MSVIVAVEEGSDPALTVAREVARLKHTALRVLHPPSVEVADDHQETYEGAMQDALFAAAKRDERPWLVLSTRSADDPPHVGLGLAARRVLATTDRPVLLVRPELAARPWALEQVLVPHDGTPTTSAALCPAAELAREIGAELFALHVAPEHVRQGQEAGSIAVPRYLDQPQHEWPAWADEFLERVRSLCPFDPGRTRFFLAHGDPAGEIVRIAHAEGVDLVVLAWHGALAPEHARTFRALLRDCPCPMLVLRVPAPSEPAHG